jgi:predicted ester cyclase
MNMKQLKRRAGLSIAWAISAVVLMAICIEGCTQESAEDIETLISHIENEVWNEGNVELLDEIYDSDCVLHVGSSMNLQGTQGFKQMITMFHKEIPDRDFRIDEIFSAGDRVTERYTWQGTHKRTGKRVQVSGCVVYHLENGKIVEAWNFEDMFGLYQQLGLVSPQALFGQQEE